MRSRGAETRTLNLRFWRPVLYQLSYTPRAVLQCRRGARRASLSPMSQRRALGFLFLVLAISLAGVAYAAFVADVWPIAFAAGVIAAWLGTMAARGLSR